MNVKSICLTVDFPVSINQYFFTFMRKGAKFPTIVISDKGKAYNIYIKRLILANNLKYHFVNGEILSLEMELYPKTKRVIDIDNYSKGLFDSLTKSGFWFDDSQVKRMLVEVKEKYPSGKAVLKIHVIGQTEVLKQNKLKLIEQAPF